MNQAYLMAQRRYSPHRTGAVEMQTANGKMYCITPTQRNIHVTSESIAVLVAAPFSFWLAMQKTLPDWARTLSAAIGVGTLLVDGGLLISYLKKDKG